MVVGEEDRLGSETFLYLIKTNQQPMISRDNC